MKTEQEIKDKILEISKGRTTNLEINITRIGIVTGLIWVLGNGNTDLIEILLNEAVETNE
jgi:hypothetical protein